MERSTPHLQAARVVATRPVHELDVGLMERPSGRDRLRTVASNLSRPPEQVEPELTGPPLPKRRIGREPEKVVGIQVAMACFAASAEASVVVPLPEAPRMWMRPGICMASV